MIVSELNHGGATMFERKELQEIESKANKMIESEYLKENKKILTRLKKVPTLKFFNEENLNELMKLSKIRKYNSGEAIIEEGSYDSWIYFLLDGKVSIVKDSKEIRIIHHPGDIFGEMGIIDGSARSASVYAIGETLCLSTDMSYIDRLSGNNKIAMAYILYKVFAEVLANRLRFTNEELVRAKEKIDRLKGKLKQ